MKKKIKKVKYKLEVKLALVEMENPTFNELVQIDGFSDISANSYLDGLPKFNEFIKDLPITISKKVEVESNDSSLEGQVYVFTGVRDKELEGILISKGAKIGSSVSKNTTHLVVKSVGSGSSKEVKAIELGIQIISIDDLKSEQN